MSTSTSDPSFLVRRVSLWMTLPSSACRSSSSPSVRRSACLATSSLTCVADRLFRRVAEQVLGRGIPRPDDVVRVDGHDGLRTHLQQRLEEPSLTAHLGDVVIDGEGADGFAVRDDGGGEQLDVDDAAVFARAARDALDVFARGDASPERVGLAVQLLGDRHEVVEVAPGGFLAGVTEEAFRGWVPGHHAVVEIGDDDGRRADLQDRLEPRGLPPERLVRGRPIGTVALGAQRSPPGGIVDAPEGGCPGSGAVAA